MQHLVCYSTTFCPLFVAISEEQCISRFNICFLRKELGEVYNSYNNSEKEREVCRPSRVDGIHDGFDKKKQSKWRMFTELKRFGGEFIAAVLSTVILRLCAVSNTILKFLFNVKLVS